MTKSKVDMLNGPLFSGILAYSIPIIFTGILQLLFNAADLVVVGQFCGSISVAAVGATSPLTHLLVNLFVGLSVGAGVNVAHAIGAQDNDAIHRTVHTAIPLALVCGVLMTVIGIIFSDRFLLLMATPANVLPLSSTYVKIYFGGITFTMVYNFAAAILRAAGDTKGPLVYLTAAGIINVMLNVFFVTVLDMNVAGVAWATTISQAIAALLVVRALMRRTDACKLILSKMRFYAAQLLRILRIGLPAGIQGSLFAISNVIIQSSINSFGDPAISGNSAAGTIDGFLYVILNAFHQTAQNYIGQNTGARQMGRIRSVFGVCLGYTTLFGIVIGILMYVFGPQLLSIYITDSEEAIVCGMIRLLYVGLPYFIFGIMDVTTGALRGMGAAMTPMIISVAGICGIRFIWIYTIFQLPQYHTLECLYLSYLASWIVTLVGQCIAFFVVYRRTARQIQNSCV